MSKYEGHIHSIIPGTAGSVTGTNSLRLSRFDVGVGWTGYGRTSDTNYWAMIEPTYNGNSGPGVPGLSGQTGGIVVYEYKAANGPSIVSFAPGQTASFVDYAVLRGAGASTLTSAFAYFASSTTGTAVTNTFKSIPEIGSLVYAFDVDQAACVRPSASYTVPNSAQNRELSQARRSWTATAGASLPNYRGVDLTFNQIPWYLDFTTDVNDSITFNTSGATGTFLTGKSDTCISMWIQFTSLANAFDIITLIATGGQYIDMYYDGTDVVVDVLLGTTGQIRWSSPAAGKWMNLTISLDSRDEGTVSLYYNGTLAGSAVDLGGAWTSWNTFSTNTVVGGSLAPNIANFYLNCVYIWSNSLAQTQTSTGLDGIDFFFEGSKREFNI